MLGLGYTMANKADKTSALVERPLTLQWKEYKLNKVLNIHIHHIL